MAKHYRRTDNPKGLVPQERDLETLTRLVRNRVMCGLQIAHLSGDAEYYRKRVRRLYENGYIDKIHNPFRDFTQTGSVSHIYRIGERGIDFLNAYDDRISPYLYRQLRWSSVPPEPQQLPHRLAQVETISLIEAACRATNGVIQFIPRERIVDQLMPEDVREGARPLTYRTTFSYFTHGGDYAERSVDITPDDLFALRVPGHPDGPQTFFFVLEEDRKTDIYKSNLEQSSHYRKFLSYSSVEAVDGFHSWLGIRKPRILTTMSLNDKVEQTIKTLGGKLKGTDGYVPSRFLFLAKENLPSTPRERLESARNLFTTPLVTASGRETYLIDQKILKAINLV